MMNRKLSNPANWIYPSDTHSLNSVELMRLFAKDAVAVRLAVLCGIIGAEITLRAMGLAARIGVLLALLNASSMQLS